MRSTQSWTVRFALAAGQSERAVAVEHHFEFAFHKGHYAIVNVLRGARLQDRHAADCLRADTGSTASAAESTPVWFHSLGTARACLLQPPVEIRPATNAVRGNPIGDGDPISPWFKTLIIWVCVNRHFRTATPAREPWNPIFDGVPSKDTYVGGQELPARGHRTARYSPQ